MEYFSARSATTSSQLPDETVFQLVRQWLEEGAGIVGAVVTGTGAASQFGDPDSYGRDEGFA